MSENPTGYCPTMCCIKQNETCGAPFLSNPIHSLITKWSGVCFFCPLPLGFWLFAYVLMLKDVAMWDLYELISLWNLGDTNKCFTIFITNWIFMLKTKQKLVNICLKRSVACIIWMSVSNLRISVLSSKENRVGTLKRMISLYVTLALNNSKLMLPSHMRQFLFFIL